MNLLNCTFTCPISQCSIRPFSFLKLASLITCSSLHASRAAMFGGTPASISCCVKNWCLSYTACQWGSNSLLFFFSSSNYFSYRLYIGAVNGNIFHASDSAIFMKYSLVPPFRKTGVKVPNSNDFPESTKKRGPILGLFPEINFFGIPSKVQCLCGFTGFGADVTSQYSPPF